MNRGIVAVAFVAAVGVALKLCYDNDVFYRLRYRCL